MQERTVKPGLLALAGAVMPFVLAGSFFTGLGSVAAEPSLVSLLAGGYFAIVGVILVYLAIMILFDEKRGRTWGVLAVAGNAVMGIVVIGFNSGILISSNSAVFEGLTLIGLLIGQALGVVGGLMSVLAQHQSPRPPC